MGSHYGGELSVTRGGANNHLRAYTWTFLAETIRTTRSGMFGIGRSGTTGYHDIVYVVRSGANCFFEYPVTRAGVGTTYERYQAVSRRDAHGNILPSQSYHFQQGDIVVCSLENHATNPAHGQNTPLQNVFSIHRYDQRGNFLETVFFNDTQIQNPGASDQASLPNLSFFDFNRWQHYAGDAGGAFNAPTINIEEVEFESDTPLDQVIPSHGFSK